MIGEQKNDPQLPSCFSSLLMLFGPPLTIIGGLALYLHFAGHIDSSAMIIEMHRIATTPILVAIPLFTFAGISFQKVEPLRGYPSHGLLPRWMPGGYRSSPSSPVPPLRLNRRYGFTIIAMAESSSRP